MKMHSYVTARYRRRAVAIVTIAVTVPVLLGFAALTVDVGWMYNVRAQLQHTADAAAHAGALLLPVDGQSARAAAHQAAVTNYPGSGTILADADLLLGNWDSEFGVFTTGGEPVNAVRVTTRRSEANGNPVDLFFAGILGRYYTDTSAAATAYSPEGAPPLGVRFLIDDEMFDTDVPGH